MTTATKKTATKKAPKSASKVVKKAPAPSAKNVDEFAVIETGGKQHIVSVGDTVEVELLGEHTEGDAITFDKVLMTDNGKDVTIGTPYIEKAKVTGTYQGEKKGRKLSIIRFQSKSNRSRKLGHRQKYAIVTIDSIQ